MMAGRSLLLAMLAVGAAALGGCADPDPVLPPVSASTPLCVLAGPGDVRAIGQEDLAFYGTDLGFTYERDGALQILFGDSWSTPSALDIERGVPRDDAYGSIDLGAFPDLASVVAACVAGAAPPVRFGTYADGTIATLDPGHAMDLGKTPLTAWTSGGQELAIFGLAKPLGCAIATDCGPGLACDTGLGFTLEEYFEETGQTGVCMDGTLGCLDDTMADGAGLPIPGTGFCVDPGSSIAAPTERGRLSSVAIRNRVGIREPNGHDFLSVEWPTNRFINPAATPVRDFDPARAPEDNDYRAPRGAATGTERVFVFGRPHFAGVSANGRNLHLYLLVATPPTPDGAGGVDWAPSYFAGIEDGRPTFSTDPSAAASLDLSGTPTPETEAFDIVQQMSVRYFEALGKWVMLYGGSLSTRSPIWPRCGLLEAFVGPDCEAVVRGNGGIHLRTADHPWGPWSAPRTIYDPGRPEDGPVPGSAFGPGGILRHPGCTMATCAPHSPNPFYPIDEVGFLYAANIIEQWTEIGADRSVDMVWNVSTWDPYTVVLMRTHLDAL